MLATNVHLNVIISYTNDFATYQYVQDLYKKTLINICDEYT